jgi:hypothetical protein
VSFVPVLRYSATGSKPNWGAIHNPVTRTPSPTVPIAESELPGQPDELRMSPRHLMGRQSRKNVEVPVRLNFGDLLALLRLADVCWASSHRIPFCTRSQGQNSSAAEALRAKIDETVLPVVITEQGEKRNQS